MNIQKNLDYKIFKTNINNKTKLKLLLLEDNSFIGYDEFNKIYIGNLYNIFHLSMFVFEKKVKDKKKIQIFNGKINYLNNNIEGFYNLVSLDEAFGIYNDLNSTDSNLFDFFNNNDNNFDIDKFINLYENNCKSNNKNSNLLLKQLFKDLSTKIIEQEKVIEKIKK